MTFIGNFILLVLKIITNLPNIPRKVGCPLGTKPQTDFTLTESFKYKNKQK